MRFGTQVCGEPALGAAREWLVADGRGGYAMGTVSGLRTRRYHALLVVAGDTPAARQVGLAALDPVVRPPGGRIVRLGVHEWADGTIAPQGHLLLEEFALVDGLPRWRWRIGATVLERTLAMRHGSPCVAVVDRLVGGGPVELSLEALCTWRDQHGERRAGDLPVHEVAGGAVVAGAYRLRGRLAAGGGPASAPAGPPDTRPWADRAADAGWAPDGTWLRNVHHRMEAARGYVPNEDLLLAGRFTATLAEPGDALEVTAWAGDLSVEPPSAATIVDTERARRRALTAGAADADAARLTLAADAFVVTTAGGPDVVAGYPWFGAWSRDTMTSYEGLFLTTGRLEQGRELLRAYAATLSEGMLANTADGGAVGYNTADATLWFLHAIDRHVRASDDDDLAAELVPALDEVLAAHLRGTRYGIKVDESDGLLVQGADGEALTWMDARVDGMGVTPRAGKAVDINALWCNGLAALAALRERAGRHSDDVRRRHAVTEAAFRRRFPAPGGHLYDVLDPDDAALRPNQLLAWSLPYAPMEPDPAVLHRITDALLTPLGPRSLDPADPAYRPVHGGTLRDRDLAYHQGTVWPWLIGPLGDALRRAGLPTRGVLTGLLAHLGDHGLGSVSETADGDAPHRATGCPFQAWSVAETMRIHVTSTE
ncbi:amylo-alpha-1,6-glucosidase [Catellatospora chokoriensis]|uniref:Glycogen debranching protein n=1 Tax=Catellatospora chokoriensis TaxID=310353 RepID=A0A8J3JLF3_9ACTN|nr:amylo-alpha-1,6-glucosidase [Catellatospora chokoriensis]GIF87171.1 glycogen debranching protein [Catellatospora chokoriensis]